MVRYIIVFTLCASALITYSQDKQVPDRVSPVAHELGVQKQSYSPIHFAPFSQADDASLRQRHIEAVGGQTYWHADRRAIDEIREQKPTLLSLDLPLDSKNIRAVEVYRVDIFSGQFVIRTSDGSVYPPNEDLVFYRGTLADDPASLAVVSVLGDELRILVSDASGNYRIQISEENTYISYQDENLRYHQEYECLVDEELVIAEKDEEQNRSTSSSGNCVEVYFECDFKSYQDNGSSITQTEAWVASLFNEVSTLYANEEIPIGISEIFVWTESDPYAVHNSTTAMLFEFQSLRNTTGYNGRLAHLLSTRSVGGGVAFVNTLCSTTSSYAVSGSLNTNIVPVPNYSWNVEVVTHEMGHNFGSKHTHACVWNGNNTQIDDCGNQFVYNQGGMPEGDACFDENNPILPADGTIMSYCHLISGIGINFSLGFGTQPGGLILSKYENASCNTGTCSAPLCTQLESPENGDTSVAVNIDIEWFESPGANGYYLFVGTTPTGNEILDSIDVGGTTSYNAGVLPDTTTIYVRVLPYNMLGMATGCQQDSFTTGTGIEYCPSQGNNVSYEWIDLFSFGEFSHTSGAMNYSDFTEYIISVTKETTYPFSASMGYMGPSYPEYFKVWIDFNRDGDFLDSTENVFSTGPTTTTVNGNITIPASASDGMTRLRISMKWNSYATPCEFFSYGEVEDYSVYIGCNTVTTTVSSGPGSLHDVLDCVSNGDTIYFASNLNNQILQLDSVPLEISKNVVFYAEPGQNIKINANSATHCIGVANNIDVTIQGLILLAGTDIQGAGVMNYGNLILRDTDILGHPSGNYESLVMNNSILRIEGNCFFDANY